MDAAPRLGVPLWEQRGVVWSAGQRVGRDPVKGNIQGTAGGGTCPFLALKSA